MRFLGKTKNFAKTARFWSQNVQLVPIKKMNTHTLWFHPQIKELSAVLRDQITVQSHHLQWKDFQKNEPYAHRFCACDSFFDCHTQGNSKKCHSHGNGNFVWEFQVRYNNIRILHGCEGRIEHSVTRVTLFVITRLSE